MKIVVVSGGFDPLHSGHIAYFRSAKELGNKLVVGINSDSWLTRKKGKPFMPWFERSQIIQSIKYVDYIMEFNDDDGSAKLLLKLVKQTFPNDEIICANGGDRNKDNIPEMQIQNPRLSFVFGVGGDNKANSSSWILREWKNPKTLRQWGYYRILHDVAGCKVKELTVEPGNSLSMQKHFKRNEYWLISEGKCDVNTMLPNSSSPMTLTLSRHQSYHVDMNYWHQLTNPYSTPCRIVEVQYGEMCIEEDIERQNA
jgi:cytidyltransferase-like protein